MKKLSILTGLFFVLFVGLVSAAPEIKLVELTPPIANTTTDLTASITCQGLGTLTAYWEVNKGASIVDTGSLIVANGTKTLADTIPKTLTAKGQVWNVVAWCGNATMNSTKLTSNSVTIENSVPVVISASLAPASATPQTMFSCSGTGSDADADTLTPAYRFMRSGTQLQDWGSQSTYQCTESNCPVGSLISCQYRVFDGTVNSLAVSSNVVLITAPASSMTITNVALGGASQEKSNSRKDRVVTTSSQMTVTNTGTNTLSAITLTSQGIASKYNVSISPSSIQTLSPGQSTSVTVTVNVPEDFDAFDPGATNPQDDRAFRIGSIQASATDGMSVVSASNTLTLETENKLRIYRLYVTVGTDEERVSDGDTLRDITPGQQVEVRLIATSRYSRTDDVDVEDILFTAIIDEGDVDVFEDEDIRDIRAGDSNTEATIKFTLEDDIDEDTYTMKVILQGEDNYGASHGEEWEIQFRVRKERREINIQSSVLSPDIVSCQRTASLLVRLKNTGRDDSDEVNLLVKNDALGIYSRIRNIDLDDGEDYARTISLSIGSSVAPGLYPIQVFTYFDDSAFSNEDISKFMTVDLRVDRCGTAPADDTQTGTDPRPTDPTTPPSDDSIVVIVDPVAPTTPPTTGRPPAEIKTGLDDDTILILIILGYVIAIGVGIILLVSLFKRR